MSREIWSVRELSSADEYQMYEEEPYTKNGVVSSFYLWGLTMRMMSVLKTMRLRKDA